MTRCCTWKRHIYSCIHTNIFSIHTICSYTIDNEKHCTNIALIYNKIDSINSERVHAILNSYNDTKKWICVCA